MNEFRIIKEPAFFAGDKLEEAHYFLNQMELYRQNRKRFVYNLNAFVNSARNVTFLLQKEFDTDASFKAWYSKKRKEMKDDGLMAFFVKIRDFSIHEEGTPRHSLSLKIVYPLPKSGRTPAFMFSDRKISSGEKDPTFLLVMPTYDRVGMHSGSKLIAPSHSEITHWEFEDIPEDYRGKDMLELCSEYYRKLEQLVLEAERVVRKSVFGRKK